MHMAYLSPPLTCQLRCEFHAEGDNHWVCPSFPEVHYDRENSKGDTCAIVVRKIEEHHEGGKRDKWGLTPQSFGQ